MKLLLKLGITFLVLSYVWSHYNIAFKIKEK